MAADLVICWSTLHLIVTVDMRHFQSNTRAERRVLNCIDAFYTDTVAHWISVELSHLHACQITSREITMHNQTFLCTQIEVFYELNAAAVQSAARGEERACGGIARDDPRFLPPTDAGSCATELQQTGDGAATGAHSGSALWTPAHRAERERAPNLHKVP